MRDERRRRGDGERAEEALGAADDGRVLVRLGFLGGDNLRRRSCQCGVDFGRKGEVLTFIARLAKLSAEDDEGSRRRS